jgi:hypothetical protein
MASMTSTRMLRILLALALLAVWQAALLHPLQHVDAHGAFVHVPGKHLPKVPGDRSASSLLCDAIAAVTACVAGLLPPATFAAAAVEPVPARSVVALRAASPLAYRSQAPPALL